MKDLALRNIVQVDTLPTVVVEMKGAKVYLNSDNREYTCDGTSWTKVILDSDIGTAAASNVGDFDAAGSASIVQTNLNTHTSNQSNPHQVAIDQLVGTTGLASAIMGDKLIYSGSAWVATPDVMPVSAGAGVRYFLTAVPSTDGSGYDLMSKIPDTNTEVVETVVANNNTVYLDGYIMDTDYGNGSLDAGVWSPTIYGYVSSAAGVSTLSMELFKRDVSGTETLLFTTVSDQINVTTTTLLTWNPTVQQSFTIASTDKLVAKFYATTTRTSDTTFHFIHSGTDHYSHIDTPLITHHNDLKGKEGGDGTHFIHMSSAQDTLLTGATSTDVPDTLVKRDASGNFVAGTITGNITGSAGSASTAAVSTVLQTGRTISATGDITFTTGAFDGSSNVTGTATLATVTISKGGTGATTAASARTNLGLGTAATQNTTAFDAAGTASTVQTNLNTHIADHANPHQVTISQLGGTSGMTTPNTGDLLSYNGSTWAPHASSIAAQSGNNGLFLKTDGTNTSWAGVTQLLTATFVSNSSTVVIDDSATYIVDLVGALTAAGTFTITLPSVPFSVYFDNTTTGGFPITLNGSIDIPPDVSLWYFDGSVFEQVFGVNQYVPVATTVNGKALSSSITLNKSDLSLGNVDNTSDTTKNAASVTLTNKTISTASNTLIIGQDLSFGSFKATNMADPVAGTDGANKTYVDYAVAGLSNKITAAAATVAALPTYTYNNGSSGVGATITGVSVGALALDGYTVNVNDLVLVKNETSTNAPYNGVYSVTVAGGVAAVFVLTRVGAMDHSSEFAGASIFVTSGSTLASTTWSCVTSSPNIGTTNIVFTQSGASSTYSAGSGLNLSGTQFSVNSSTVPFKSDNLSVFASTSSAQLAGVISDETGSGSLVFGTSPTLTTTNFSGQSIQTTDGVYFKQGLDTSPIYKFSWTNLTSGDIYTLLGEFCMDGWCHNTAINSSGNFVGRFDAGSCEMHVITEAGLEKWYTAVADSVGVVPTWVQKTVYTASTGSIVYGGGITASNFTGSSSGTNTGDQTISLTGDVTGSGVSSFSATLSNTTVTAGSYTLANVTFDSKGRATTASNTATTGSGNVVLATSPTLTTPNISGQQVTSTDGVYRKLGLDTSPMFEFTGTVLTSGALYTLLGEFCMWGKSHNTYPDASGNFVNRLDAGACELHVITESGLEKWFTDNTTVINTPPTWTLETTYNSHTGSVSYLGTVTGSNVSGTNTGDQTISLTGDVTGSGKGSFSATLSNTGVTAGSYVNTSVTVDSKGRISSISSGSAGMTMGLALAGYPTI